MVHEPSRRVAYPGGNPAIAFYGYMWRPWILIAGMYLLALFTTMPLWSLPEDPGPLVASWRAGVSSPEVLVAVWRETLMIPLGVGIAIGIATGMLRSRPFAWTLPSLDRRLLGGALPVMVLLAAAIAFAHSPVIGLVPSLAAAGVSLLAYAVGATLVSPEFGKVARTVIAGGVLAMVLRPQALVDLASRAPLEVALACSGAAALLMVRGATATVAREYHRVGGEALQHGLAARLVFGSKRELPQYAPLEADTLVGWWRAANYSAQTGLGRLAVPVAFMVSFAYVTGNPALLIMSIALPMHGMGVGQPEGRLLYPLSRARRGQLAYLRSLALILTSTLLVALFATPLFLLRPFPQVLVSAGTPSVNVAPLLCACFAWAPVAHWASTRPPLMDTRRQYVGAQLVARFGGLMVFLIVVMSTRGAYRGFADRLPFAVWLVSFGLLVVVIQGLHYLLIRRAYASRDLL
ncbi:MAG: hypothetical protein V4550_10995 [Gemmatimonadota bacterium]